MLFKLNKDFTVILHPECYKLCPALKTLSEKQMRYLILAYDYDSPYRLLPLEERQRTARAQVYGSVTIDPEEESKLVKSSVEIFTSLQYDARRESKEVYLTKILRLEKELVSATSTQEITNITKSIKLLMDAIRDIEKEMVKDESLEELEGGGKLSLLEQLQKNKKLYKMHHHDISSQV